MSGFCYFYFETDNGSGVVSMPLLGTWSVLIFRMKLMSYSTASVCNGVQIMKQTPARWIVMEETK